mmetsp:Transcript_16396/g.49140  ORF Transcript_16396/g.49140 Transcript_16396/m.49140 type:complete len:120 (-) Transcript_16396:136-495(-)
MSYISLQMGEVWDRKRYSPSNPEEAGHKLTPSRRDAAFLTSGLLSEMVVRVRLQRTAQRRPGILKGEDSVRTLHAPSLAYLAGAPWQGVAAGAGDAERRRRGTPPSQPPCCLPGRGLIA